MSEHNQHRHHVHHDQDYSQITFSWIPSFSQLIQLYFVIITTTAILAAILPPLRDSILSYGKLDYPSSSSSSTNSKTDTTTPSTLTNHGQFFAILKTFRVPKIWFAHFYIFATAWMTYLSLDLLIYTIHPSSSSSPTSPLLQAVPTILITTYPSWSFLSLLTYLGIMPSQPDSLPSWTPPNAVLLAMTCYLIHVIRRWYESCFVERPSPQAMLHVGHYLVGISFYSAVAPALWVDAYESWVTSTLQQQNTTEKQVSLFGLLSVQAWVGLALFLWGSWHQYNCHVILANLRKPNTLATQKPPKQEYKVPFGDWFQYFVAPHYSAEMIIYLGFYLMASSESSLIPGSVSTLLFAWIWVVVNLTIVARETDQWYKTRFGEGYADATVKVNGRQHVQKTKRAILIPFVY